MLLTISLIFRAISLINMQAAICVLIALLPTYLIRFKLFGLPTTFLEIMLIMVIGGWIAKKLLAKNFKKSIAEIFNKIPKILKIIIGFFLLSATISLFISPNTLDALGIWKAYFIEPIILFLICLDVFQTKDDAKKIIGALAISAFFVSAMAVVQKFSGWFVPYTFWGKDNVYRVTSFYGFPNAIGLYLVPIFPLLLLKLTTSWKKFTAVHKREKIKSFGKIFILILSIAFSVLAIIWSHSTGAMAAIIGGALIIALLNKKTRWLAILLIIIAGVLIYLNPAPKIVSEILLKDWSGQVRIKMWQETWTMLKDNPIFGAGLSGYQTTIAPYHIWPFVEIFMYPHNFILTFWSELGLLGLLSWIGLLIFIFKLSTRTDRTIALAVIWSVSAIIIHGLVDVPYFKNDLSILFWLLFALLCLSSRQNDHDHHVNLIPKN
ncbi:MAG: O-antigen ligase family protein [Candidatus Falkowbacteria bacterium]